MSFVCSEVENMSISINYYEFIKQMYETLTKYIKGYKSETNDYFKKISKMHEKYYPKLSGMKEELKKMTNIKTNHIISLSSKVPKIIGQQITNLKYFISGIEAIIKSFDKTLKEKNSMSSKYQSEYDECRNSLVKKYKDIEKYKNNYFVNASQTEDIIYKYYINKFPRLDKSSGVQEISTFTPITEIQMENSIKQKKKKEKEYLNLVKTAKPLEDKFFELSDNSNDNMKRIACEIITKMKDNIVDFLLLLKNCFKLPLSEIDTYLPELIKLDENKKIEHIINSTYKKDHNLIPIGIEKYNIKLLDKQNDNPDDDDNYMIEDDEVLNTIKKMKDNFELIENNSIEKMNNQDKLRCRELTCKLLSFSKNVIKDLKEEKSKYETNKNDENKINNENKEANNNNINENKDDNDKKNDTENKYNITKEEIEELSKLIENKGNRTTFLRKINTFRKYGEFEIPEREFNIICDLLNKSIDAFQKENDLASMNNLIILSQTYYKLENNNKIYIQKIIKKNVIFRKKEFWEDYVNSIIIKEVQKHINKDINDPKFIDSQKSMENQKYEKIIFAQLLPLINNMIDFDLDDDIIKSIVQILISYYKINEESSKTIYEMIKFKGIEGNEQRKKYYKDLNLSVINEKEGEEFDNQNERFHIHKETNNQEKKKEEEKVEAEDEEEVVKIEEEEDDDDEKINRDMIINVNQTQADEEIEDDEEINKKLIKNMTSDEIEDEEINDQIVKEEDDDEDKNKTEQKEEDKKEDKNKENIEVKKEEK